MYQLAVAQARPPRESWPATRGRRWRTFEGEMRKQESLLKLHDPREMATTAATGPRGK